MGGFFSSIKMANQQGNEAALQMAKEIASSAPVVMFSKVFCGYCKRAKQLLTQIGATFKVIELDEENDGYEIQAALGQWTGLRTVPNIFIGGKHIGGCDSLLHKYQNGELLGLLAEAGAIPDATKPHKAQAEPNTNDGGSHGGRIIDA